MGIRILMPLASGDFDTTEVAVPWSTLARAGHEVVFATEDGQPGRCDPRLLTGVIFGRLGARPDAVAIYKNLESDPKFTNPIRYADVRLEDYAGIVLHGGHAPGMRQYLESKTLQEKVAGFWAAGAPVGAICHGTIVLARTIDPRTGHSVIRGRRMTALTKLLERTAYYLTFWKLGRYYRTYPAYVQDEVIAALGDRALFETGPRPSYARPFTVRDGNLVTARWPGDAQKFADDFVALVSERLSRPRDKSARAAPAL